MTRLLPAFVLPIAVTGIVLATVAWNRSSARGPTVLTVGELSVRRTSADNSVRRVRFAWMEYGATGEGVLTRDRLATIGFDVSVDPAAPGAPRHYGRLLPKQLWIVFEISASSRDRADGGREPVSPPVLVDVGHDVDALAAKYPNGATHLITAGVVQAFLAQPMGKPAYVAATVTEIRPSELHVPRELAGALASPNARVSVHYGRRYEPWIVDISR